MVLTSLAFGDRLDDHPLGFIDNEASKFALIKGYSSDDAINTVVSLFWTHLHLCHIGLWLERVSSAGNPSDEVSQNGWTLATELNWTHVHLDLTKCYTLLLECLHRPEHIPQGLAQAMHHDLRAQVARQIGPAPPRTGRPSPLATRGHPPGDLDRAFIHYRSQKWCTQINAPTSSHRGNHFSEPRPVIPRSGRSSNAVRSESSGTE